jgi:hypothetical protein
VPEHFAVSVDDADVKIGHEDQDPFVAMRAPDSDVMQTAVVAQRDDSAGVHAIATHTQVRCGGHGVTRR